MNICRWPLQIVCEFTEIIFTFSALYLKDYCYTQSFQRQNILYFHLLYRAKTYMWIFYVKRSMRRMYLILLKRDDCSDQAS